MTSIDITPVNRPGTPDYGDEIRARVERVRRGVDPAGVFAADVAP